MSTATAESIRHARARFTQPREVTVSPAAPETPGTLTGVLMALLTAHISQHWAKAIELHGALSRHRLAVAFCRPEHDLPAGVRLAQAKPIIDRLADAHEAVDGTRFAAIRDELAALGVYAGTYAEVSTFARTLEDGRAVGIIHAHANPDRLSGSRNFM